MPRPVSRKLELEETQALGYFSLYLVVVYAFTRIDWKILLRDKRWKWLPKSHQFGSPG